MATQFEFNAANVAPNAGFDVLPKGWYNAQIEETEVKPTKAGDGNYLSCAFVIMDGFAKGRKIFQNYNLRNPNPEAEKIGMGQLSALMHAMNYLEIKASTGELHNRPVKIKLKVKEAVQGSNYDDQNEITSYKPYGDTSVQMAQPATATSAPAGGFSGPPAGFNPMPNTPPAGYTPPPTQPPVAQAPAPVSAPPVAAPPTPPTPPVPVAAPPAPVRKLTEKAAGATYEQLIAKGWTDKMLIEHGLMLEDAPPVAAPPTPDSFVPPAAAQPWNAAPPIPENAQPVETSFANTPPSAAVPPVAAPPSAPPVHGEARPPWENGPQ